MSNIARITLVYFCTRFHLYLHAYALLLQSRDLTLLQISMIESVVIASVFLMEVPTGVLADRFGRKWSIVISTALLMCGELMFLFARDFSLYLVMAMLTGTGFAFVSGAAESLIYESLPRDGRDAAMQKVMARYAGVGQVAFFLSPLVGSVLLGDLAPERFNIAILGTVGVLFVGVLVSLTLREPAADWEVRRASPLSIAREGWRGFIANPPLRRFALFVIVTMPFNGLLVTTLAAPYLTSVQVPPVWVAGALSAGSLIAVFTPTLAARLGRRFGLMSTLRFLTLIPAAFYLIAAFSGQAPAGWGIIVALYAVNDMRMPLVSAYQNKLIDSTSRATTLSLVNMLGSLYAAAAAPVFAAIATQSIAAGFAALALVIGVMGVLFAPMRAPQSTITADADPLSNG